MAVKRKNDALVCEKEDIGDDVVNYQEITFRLNVSKEDVVFFKQVSAKQRFSEK